MYFRKIHRISLRILIVDHPFYYVYIDLVVVFASLLPYHSLSSPKPSLIPGLLVAIIWETAKARGTSRSVTIGWKDGG